MNLGALHQSRDQIGGGASCAQGESRHRPAQLPGPAEETPAHDEPGRKKRGGQMSEAQAGVGRSGSAEMDAFGPVHSQEEQGQENEGGRLRQGKAAEHIQGVIRQKDPERSGQQRRPDR